MEKLFAFIIDIGSLTTIFIAVNGLVRYMNINGKKKSKKIIAWILIIIGIASLFIRRFYIELDSYYATILLALGFSSFYGGVHLFKNIKGDVA